MIRPFLKLMTKSELHAVMVGGFATIAGGVLAAYIKFGVFFFSFLLLCIIYVDLVLLSYLFIYYFYCRCRLSDTDLYECWLVQMDFLVPVKAALCMYDLLFIG